ncbi:MAG: phage portal protein [Thermoleophilia bacterium]|nr:phage portal protein [Thermoleophilia bacterium]
MLQDIREADAWYSGDQDKLMAHTGMTVKLPSQQNSFGISFRGGISFWRRRANDRTGKQINRIHVPVASDIAAANSDMLFGDAPVIQIPEAHLETALTDAKLTEDRLQELLGLLSFESMLLEAADVCSGIGGIYLVPGWDKEVADYPLVSVIHQDAAIPEYRMGHLTAVTFWRQVEKDGKKIMRHLERHEKGVIFHGLYSGSDDFLGDAVPLADHKSTADFDPEIKLPDGISLLPAYIPNMMPNQKRRGLRVGRSDTAGCESLMDALDETFTSWMRDIRVGQARIIVPDEFLERSGRGQGARFDLDRELFVGLDMDPGSFEKAGITENQFTIRTQEHADTAVSLFERIVTSAGYSPQSFGLHIEGQGESGIALRTREKKSINTTGKKAKYWQSAVESTLEKVLIIDKAEFSGSHKIFRPRVEIEGNFARDPRETAETIDLLRRAGAASTRIRVKMAQPHLEGEELEGEVQRVMEEEGMIVEDPTGGLV